VCASKKNATKENETATVNNIVNDMPTTALLSHAQQQAMCECTEEVIKHHEYGDEVTASAYINDDDGNNDDDDNNVMADETLLSDELPELYGEGSSNLLYGEGSSNLLKGLATLFDLKRGSSDGDWHKIALSTAMDILPLLTMKNREAGSTKMDRKVKSLRERWFSIGGLKKDTKAESCGPMVIE
jgi:hypothetical protein